MNVAVAPLMTFEPAYGQLQPDERAFVDGYVAEVQERADRQGVRLLAAVKQQPPALDNRSMALLVRPMVRAAIAERVKDLSDLYDVSIHRTLREVTNIAHSNVANYMYRDPRMGPDAEPEIDWNRATPEQMAAVQSIVVEDKRGGGRKVTFKLYDKLAALALLMRYQGVLTEGNSHFMAAEASVRPSTLPDTATVDQAANVYALAIDG